MSATFAVNLPSGPDRLVPFVRRAEELGFDAVWTQDSLITSSFSLDGLHALSYVAAVTERLRLGISVLYSGRRNPAVAARELATIDQLSNGRLIVGIGIGNAYHRPNLHAVGINTDRPVERFVDGIAVMRALWSQDEAEYHGEVYSFSGIRSQPKPIQRPGPPIWIGARAQRSLARAVRIGDGWTGAGPVGTDDFLDQLAIVRRELDAQRRDPASFTVSKNVYVVVDSTKERARDHAVAYFRRTFANNPVYDADAMTDRVAVYGTAEDCAEGLRRLLDAGVHHIVLHDLYAPMEQLDAFASVTKLI
ncbi:LLM class F420-dependent oxidoreductase [Pseudonocardia acaciae]|uniref:LLM class F420-dependent oxidoreductase n=1 Tax=Pseudonocardia acaciae TaxID=551276 RepID=UPI000686A774|nr:LLM class F420-dependent oxidoreductase [Pseudonocardia acaciae]